MNPAVLLVDDEHSICSALQRTFRQHHYRVFQANSGAQALALLGQNQIDVIVSDQCMPGMTGTQLLTIAKNLYPDTARIILSGHTDINDLTTAINEASIYRFISKPWDEQYLLNAVNSAIPVTPAITTATPPVAPTRAMPYPNATHLLHSGKVLKLEDAIDKKNIDLEKSIKNNTLDIAPLFLKNHFQHDNGEALDMLEYCTIHWPKFNNLSHEGIIGIADQCGYVDELFTWYLINIIEQINNHKSNKKIVVDLFSNSVCHRHSLQQLLQTLLQHTQVTFRIPFDMLRTDSFTNLLMHTYHENGTLLLNLGKRIIDINDLESTPVRYIEMDGKMSSLQNSLLTEKRLAMIATAQQLNIKTVLSDVKYKSQKNSFQESTLNYAHNMQFDFF
jgi:CheY-like chemotaxis protein